MATCLHQKYKQVFPRVRGNTIRAHVWAMTRSVIHQESAHQEGQTTGGQRRDRIIRRKCDIITNIYDVQESFNEEQAK